MEINFPTSNFLRTPDFRAANNGASSNMMGGGGPRMETHPMCSPHTPLATTVAMGTSAGTCESCGKTCQCTVEAAEEHQRVVAAGVSNQLNRFHLMAII